MEVDFDVDFDKVVRAFSYEGEVYALSETDSGAGVMSVFGDGAWADVDDPALIIAEGKVISIPMLKSLVKLLDSTNAR